MRAAIIGAGYSGTMAAVELARAGCREVILIEKSGRFATGAAYSTSSPGHLLNVRAAQMSAFADAPDHFARWAEQEGVGGPQDFVQRREFGRYLEGVLEGAPEVRRVTGEAIALENGAVRLDSGERVECDAVVLAGGNYPSRLPDMFGDEAVHDPWSAEGREKVARLALAGGDLLLVGTGLTMVDMCVSLEEAGFGGRIVATSRRGLVPRAHEERPAEVPEWVPPTRLAELVGAVRARKPWRAAIDGLRPHSHDLWRGLSDSEKKRFLRHLRPWWDVHRHRIAPGVAKRIEAMRADRRLEVVAGRVRSVEGDEVTIARRGGGELRRRFAGVINCTGPEGNILRVTDPLIRQLLESGQARAERLGLGLEVDEDSRVVGEGGSPELYAVGPLSKGSYWEIVAVPDIRGQVRDVARAIAY
ncbi:MAG TPA: FAD-dependent oxidoreductase [Allosphingosinicella sp.]|jgi:uncharacterized NAD(P)/FAD-binding protein YdhS